jgi:probable F420-dependent oxidoreductase
LVKQCELLGLHSLWVNDRLVYDNFEPLAALAAAAGATRKIQLGTSVLLLPYRQPVLLAKTLATIDFISQGRLTLGVGIGNRESDYDAVQVPFERRGARGLECIQLMRRLWQEDSVTFRGKFFRAHDVSLGPKPHGQRSIPIWMGGSAESVLKRVALYADGYFCSTSALPNFAAIWDKIVDYAKGSGRDPNGIEKAGLNFLVIDDDKSRGVRACETYFQRSYGKAPSNIKNQMVVGSAEACIEKIENIFEAGVETLVLGLVVPDLKQLDTLAEKILPRLTREDNDPGSCAKGPRRS